MPYGSAPYGGAPYAGSAEFGLYQAGDLEEAEFGMVGEPFSSDQIYWGEFQCGDMPDEGVVGEPILVRNWGPNATTPFPTVAPSQVEANDEMFPELALEVVEHATHAHVCWLPLVITQKVRGARDDPGGISITLAHKDPALPSVTYGRMIRAWLRGQLIAKALVEPRDDTTLDPNPARQVATLGGRGGKAYLEQILVSKVWEGDVSATFTPWFPDAQTHQFNYAHPGLSHNAWPAARSKSRQGAKSPHWTGYPRSWVDRNAHWISGSLGSSKNSPDGDAYFGYTFLSTAGTYALFFTGDNTATIWIDGVSIGESSDWQSLVQHDVRLSNGIHIVRAKTTNFRQAQSNPMGLLLTMYKLTGQGKFVTNVPQIRTTNTAHQLPLNSALWRCLQFPAQQPSWTPGHIIRYLLQGARTAATDGGQTPHPVTTTFTDKADSAGRPWPFVPDWSVPVGATMLQVIQQFEESYIDCEMSPGTWKLHAWNKGTYGRTVDFDEQVNIAHRSVPPLATALLIRYQENWTRVQITPPAGFHRVEAKLNLPQVKTESMAKTIGRKVLANFGQERVEYRATLRHDTDYLPPIAMKERDRIPLPNRFGIDTTVSLRAWDLSMDSHGKITSSVEAGDLVLADAEAFQQWLDRMADGAMYGTTAQASPQTIDTYAINRRTRTVTTIPFQRDDDITSTTSHSFPVDNFSVLVDVQARLGEGESARGSDTACVILLNGTSVGTCTIPAGSLRGRLVDLGVDLERDDDVQIQIASTGFTVVVVLRFT